MAVQPRGLEQRRRHARLTTGSPSGDAMHRAALRLVLLLAVIGCHGWFAHEPGRPAPQPATVHVRTPEAWVTLHDAWLDGDSLRGRPADAGEPSLVALPVGELDC